MAINTAPRKISDAELARRWQAVRQGMKSQKLDFLIFQNASSHLDGYVKWFTDLAAGGGYPSTVIFPREDEMTTIWQGGRAPAEPSPPANQVRGVKKRISVPTIPSLGYSNTFDAEAAVNELKTFKNARIGLVGMGFIAASFYKYVTEHLTGATFVDASDMVDDIKVIKSDEEISLIRETCDFEDRLMEYLVTIVEPGKTDKEIRTEVIHKCLQWGGNQTNIIMMTGSVGRAPGSRERERRVLQNGDHLLALLETDSPSYFWGELCRTICLGSIPAELEEQFEHAKEAQKITADMLRPGIAPKVLWDANNAYLLSKGYPEERRIYAHGQGYDMVERPSLDADETMNIKSRMFFAVHPATKSEKARGWICDNFFVWDDKTERVHKTPQKIFRV